MLFEQCKLISMYAQNYMLNKFSSHSAITLMWSLFCILMVPVLHINSYLIKTHGTAGVLLLPDGYCQ